MHARYDPAAGTAAAAAVAGTAGGVLPSATGLPRVDLLGTYKACESVFLVFLPAAFGEAVAVLASLALSAAARLPGPPPFPCPCAAGVPRATAAEASAREPPEVACFNATKRAG